MTDSSDSLALTDSGTESLPAPVSAKVCPICELGYPSDFVVCPRDGARLEETSAAPDDPMVGTVLDGAYRIERAIGEGATARVYEASHVRLSKKRFAVKVLHPFYGAEPTALARFQREAEAAAAIGHPGVVDVYDINRTADGRFYIVTELLEGSDFGSLLDERKKVDVALGVHIARDVCRALSAAHRQGVVHRDMKPDNVFIGGELEQPRVKVLDFGISKIDDGANLTRTGMLIGTPAYMAPEQAAGTKIDARTDIYAVGAMLYHSLTGRKPFMGEETAEVLSGILTAEPPRPRDIEPSIPEALELVIQRAMAKQPDDRYASALELDRALAPFDTLEPSTPQQERTADAFEIKHARPLLIALSVLAGLWVVAVIDAGVLALLAEGDSGAFEARWGRFIGVTFALLVVLAGPTALSVRHLRGIWPSTPAVIDLGKRLKRALIAAVCTHAAMSLGVRILETVTAGRGGFGAAPELAFALASFAAGGIGYLTAVGRRS